MHLPLVQGGIDVADEVTHITASIEQSYHGVAGPQLRFFVPGLFGGVPTRPECFEIFAQPFQHFRKAAAGGMKIALGSHIFFTRMARNAHLFQLHVQFKYLFEQIGRSYLLFFTSGFPGRVCSLPGLLFQLHAFEREEVFRPQDGVAQGTVGIIQA